MVDGQNQNQDQRYALSDYLRAAVDGLFDGASSNQSKVYAVYNDLHTVRQLSRKSRGAYFAPALLTHKEHAQLAQIAEDATTTPSSVQSMANQSASVQTQDSDQQLCWSAHLGVYQKLFALRAADDVPLDDVQAREAFVDTLLDTGFRQENVATQEALLQAPQLDQLQRFHFFMTLSPERKYALLESNKLSLDDLVFFQERMKAQLENSQHAGSVVYAVFAFLALIATVVVGALLLAGPLGMAVSIGSVSLGVVFLQFLVKKAVNFVLDFRYAFYYGNKVNSTELSEEEKEYVRSRYQHFSKKRLLNLISIAVVVILFVGCMFFPPAMTPVLVVGFIFMAHAFGKHCEEQAQGLVSKWIRIPCILFARLLQMPLVLPRSGIRLLVYLGEKSEQGSQLYLRGQFLGLLRLPLWLLARFLQLPKTVSQGVSSSLGLLLPENVRGAAFDEVRGTLRGKYEKKAKSFLYAEAERITQFSQLGSSLSFLMDVGKQFDMVRDFFRMKREKIFCDYLAGYVAMKQQVDAVVSQGPDHNVPDDSQSFHTMDPSVLVRQVTPTLPKNLSLLPAKNRPWTNAHAQVQTLFSWLLMLRRGGVQSLKGRQQGSLVDRSQLVMRQTYSQSAYQQAFLLRKVCEEKGWRDSVEEVTRLLQVDLSTRTKQAQNNVYAMNSLLGLVLSTQSESDRSWLLTQLPASTQLAMVRASVLKPQEKMALLHVLFTQYQHNLISRARMAFSVVSAVSLALLVTVGISRGGAIGGMLSLGFAQMGLVTLHFMASRVSRLLTAVYDVRHKQQQHNARRAQDVEGEKSAAWQVEYEKNYQAELSAAKQKRFDLMVDVGSMLMMLFTVVLAPPIWVVRGCTVVVADFLGTKMQQWACVRFDMPLRQTTILAIAGLLQSPKKLTFGLLQGARLLGRKVGRLVQKNDAPLASSDAMQKTVGEVVHTAVRSSEGEMLASVFDFTQSFRDMIAYFYQVRHHAILREVMETWQSELRAQGALKNAQSSVKVGTQDLAVVLAKIKTGLPKESDSLKSHIDKDALDLQTRVDESSARVGVLSVSTKKDSSQDASISATKQGGGDATSLSGVETKVKK